MIKPLLTALLLFIFCACYSQKNDDSLYFAKLGKEELIQKYKNNIVNTFPFKEIHILDARPDTNTVGFLRLYDLADPLKLVFPKGLNNEILKFVNNNYHFNNNSSLNDLLIIVKEYRISDYAKISSQKQTNVNDWRRGIVVSAELFMQRKNNYLALYKVDSIVTLDSSILLSKLIPQSFCVLFNNISNKNLSELHIGKTEFSYADIQQHIQSFFNYPILNDSVTKNGIYKNFAEFILNKPSITNYELLPGKLSDEISVTENNQTFLLHNYWGFCNGKNIFIKSADNLFQLITANKTFNIRGAKSLNLLNGNAYTLLGGARFHPYNNQSFKIKYTALQLNMPNRRTLLKHMPRLNQLRVFFFKLFYLRY